MTARSYGIKPQTGRAWNYGPARSVTGTFPFNTRTVAEIDAEASAIRKLPKWRSEELALLDKLREERR